jgi:hypothetical protein
MTNPATNVGILAIEYETLAQEANGDCDRLKQSLTETANWTSKAANELLQLANDYGVFMLRNALALSLALKIEDGELGY